MRLIQYSQTFACKNVFSPTFHLRFTVGGKAAFPFVVEFPLQGMPIGAAPCTFANSWEKVWSSLLHLTVNKNQCEAGFAGRLKLKVEAAPPLKGHEYEPQAAIETVFKYLCCAGIKTYKWILVQTSWLQWVVTIHRVTHVAGTEDIYQTQTSSCSFWYSASDSGFNTYGWISCVVMLENVACFSKNFLDYSFLAGKWSSVPSRVTVMLFPTTAVNLQELILRIWLPPRESSPSFWTNYKLCGVMKLWLEMFMPCPL